MESQYVSSSPRRQPWVLVLPNGYARGAFRTEKELEEVYQFHPSDIEYVYDVPLGGTLGKSEGFRAFPCDLDLYTYFSLKNAVPFPVRQNLAVNDLGRLCFDTGLYDVIGGSRTYRSVSMHPYAFWHLKALSPASQVRFLDIIIQEYISANAPVIIDPMRRRRENQSRSD